MKDGMKKIYLCPTEVHKIRKNKGYSKVKEITLYNFLALMKNVNSQKAYTILNRINFKTIDI